MPQIQHSFLRSLQEEVNSRRVSASGSSEEKFLRWLFVKTVVSEPENTWMYVPGPLPRLVCWKREVYPSWA